MSVEKDNPNTHGLPEFIEKCAAAVRGASNGSGPACIAFNSATISAIPGDLEVRTRRLKAFCDLIGLIGEKTGAPVYCVTDSQNPSLISLLRRSFNSLGKNYGLTENARFLHLKGDTRPTAAVMLSVAPWKHQPVDLPVRKETVVVNPESKEFIDLLDKHSLKADEPSLQP